MDDSFSKTDIAAEEVPSEEQTVKDTDVYLLKVSEITDDQLDAFAMRPSVIKPDLMRKLPSIPQDEKPATFNLTDWHFEGFLKPVDSARAAARDQKRKLLNKYMDSLSEHDRLILEDIINAERKNERREAALNRGEVFDSREDIAAYIFSDGQVWLKKVAKNDEDDYPDSFACN
jgi:hypothetical protein